MGATLAELLDRAGAQPPRWGRGKWRCPKCSDRKAPALSVDLGREVFFCHRCHWRGGKRSLARELGETLPLESAAQRARRLAVERESERIQRWATMRWRFLADLNHLLLDVERLARESGRESLERGEPVPEAIWANLAWSLREQEKLWPELVLFSGPKPGSEQAASWARIVRARYCARHVPGIEEDKEAA